MTTIEKVNELLEYPASKFSSYELEALENMEGLDEFSERQEKWIDDLYEKHFEKDDGKL